MHMFIKDLNKFIPIHYIDMLIIYFINKLIRQWNKLYRVKSFYSYIPCIGLWANYYKVEYIFIPIYHEESGINLFLHILYLCLLESGINLIL